MVTGAALSTMGASACASYTMVTMIVLIRAQPLGPIIPDNGRIYVVLQNVVVSCRREGLAHSVTPDLCVMHSDQN